MKSFISLWFIMVEVVISRKHFRPLSEMLHLFNLFRSENCICAMQKQMTFQLFAHNIPKIKRKNLEWITKIWAINNCENDEEVEYHSDNTLREMTMSGLDYVTYYYTMHRRLIFLKVSVQKNVYNRLFCITFSYWNFYCYEDSYYRTDNNMYYNNITVVTTSCYY